MARAHTKGVRLTPAERYIVTNKIDGMRQGGLLPLKKSGAQAANEIGRSLGLKLTKWHVQASAEALGMKMSYVVHVEGTGGNVSMMANAWAHINQLEERVTKLERQAAAEAWVDSQKGGAQ